MRITTLFSRRFCLSVLGLLSNFATAAFVPDERPIDALHYKITIQVNPADESKQFSAQTIATFKALAPLTSVTLDADQLSMDKVSLVQPGHQAATVTSKGETITVNLPHKIKQGQTFTLDFRYHGQIHTHDNEGLFRVTDPNEKDRGPMLFTMFEALDARAFFPCNNQPFDKATTEVIARVPLVYDAISNGTRVGDHRVKKDGKSWREIHWSQDKPHSTYLVSLAIAPFTKLSTTSGRKEISFWVGKASAPKAQYGLEATKKAFEFFESYLGVRYPWPKYAEVGVPTFAWGGMENTSATHMNQERMLLEDPTSEYQKRRIFGLGAHELAHQWFGDYVTMKWWNDVWLNESFASLMATRATSDFFKSQEPEIETVMGTWYDYFRQEDGPRSHPIVEKELANEDVGFDAINYTKGENVLRMLSFYLGEDKFRAGLKRYLENHAYGNTTYLDLFESLEKTSAMPLAAFRDSWLLQRGYPVISYGGEWNGTDRNYQFHVTQQPNHPEDKSLFTFKLPVVFHRKTSPAYDTPITLSLDQAAHAEAVPLLAEPEWVTVNPGAVVLAKVVPEKRDEDVLANQALGDPDLLARIWAGTTLLQGLLDGKEISKTSQKTVLRMLQEDPSPYVRNALLTAFAKMKTRWLPEKLGNGVYELAVQAQDKNLTKSPLFLSDQHGWTEWRAQILGALGRVQRKEAMPFLAKQLQRPDLSLDELNRAASAVASIGDSTSISTLKQALALHEHRGYRYGYTLLYSFGALESPEAAGEIREISKTCTSDLMGTIGNAVSDNQTLKQSPEWAGFLQEFLLQNDRFGDEVKARLLSSIEEVKTPAVESMLKTVAKDSSSSRLKDLSKKTLEKNFTNRATAGT